MPTYTNSVYKTPTNIVSRIHVNLVFVGGLLWVYQERGWEDSARGYGCYGS